MTVPTCSSPCLKDGLHVAVLWRVLPPRRQDTSPYPTGQLGLVALWHSERGCKYDWVQRYRLSTSFRVLSFSTRMACPGGYCALSLSPRTRHLMQGQSDPSRTMAVTANRGYQQMLRRNQHYWRPGGFPGGSISKESTCNAKETVCSAGDLGLIPGSGRSPGEGNGNPLQYVCLGNPMDRGAVRLQFMGLQRVGHDLATKPSPYTWRLRDNL